MKRIAVVGAGPSGLMAAIAALDTGVEAAPRSTHERRERGKRPLRRGRRARNDGRGAAEPLEVVVYDRGVPLATLLRTGGGRCNLANATFDARQLAASYPRGGRFLLPAFSAFDARRTMAWFQDRGLALTVEEGGKVFPASGRAAEVRDLLLAEARRLGVQLRSRCQVVRAARRGGSFQLAIRRVHDGAEREPTPPAQGREIERFDAVILATGGDSLDPEDSGYRLARAFGHSVTRLAPSLTALATAERWPASLAGLTLPDVRIRAMLDSRKVADERGSLLFTHRGISGPLAFRISSLAAYLPYSAAAPLRLALALYPEEDEPSLEQRVDDALARHFRRSVAAAARELAPRSLVPVLLEQAGVPEERRAAQATREERRALARALAGIRLSAIAPEREGEIVTAGGIELRLVDQKTMESRIVPGLFFCGELLDIDGFTGGFNLQAAWTTGRLAGLGARRRLTGSAAC